MGNLKSREVTPLLLLENLLQDIYEQAPPGLLAKTWQVDLARDIAAVRRRFASEGEGFFTKQLPALNKWVLAYCEGLPPCTLPFAMKASGFPRFLGGLTASLSTDDEVGSHADFWYVVKAFRQVGQLFYKAASDPTPEQVVRAEERYVNVEQEIRAWDSLGPTRFQSGVFATARALVHRVLGDYSHDRFVHHVPRHGPGAVSERLRGNEKYGRHCDARLAVAFPPSRFSVTRGFVGSGAAPLDFSVKASRLCLVPKDSRGPRMICAEPVMHQWHQQYLLRCLEEVIPRGTNGRVQFSDQEKNGTLALQASSDLSLATLDMSDASDRIPASLVAYLLPPSWWAVISACRTQATVLPSGRLLHLAKFASMGSAVCFPIEALVFWSLIVAMTGASRASEQTTYVFGDDIILPKPAARHVIDLMHRLTTLRFGREKCFIDGRFRESCGVDAYAGEVVTPLRYKCQISSRLGRYDLIRFGNEAHRFGYWRTAHLIASSVPSQVLTYGWDSGIIGHLSFVPLVPHGAKWSAEHQAFRLRGECEIPVIRVSRFKDASSRLLKALVRREAPSDSAWPLPSGGMEADRVVFPRETKIFRRWRSITLPIYRHV